MLIFAGFGKLLKARAKRSTKVCVRSRSMLLSACLRNFPVAVLGISLTNSTMRGYLQAAMAFRLARRAGGVDQVRGIAGLHGMPRGFLRSVRPERVHHLRIIATDTNASLDGRGGRGKRVQSSPHADSGVLHLKLDFALGVHRVERRHDRAPLPGAKLRNDELRAILKRPARLVRDSPRGGLECID